jgi:hypothetical protein
VVREQRHRLPVRPVRHQAARQESRRDRRRYPRATSIENFPILRGYAETRYQARPARRRPYPATKFGLGIRFVVTNLDVGSAEWIYDSLYCARGRAENLIKLA